MYKKGMRRAAALLAVCWLGLLFRAAAETPAEKLERLPNCWRWTEAPKALRRA